MAAMHFGQERGIRAAYINLNKNRKCLLMWRMNLLNDRADVSPFLSVFLLPCNTVYLWVCLYSLFIHILGPVGAGRSPRTPFPLRLWALTLKPKRREKHEERISLPTVQLCVLYCCMLKYTVLSFNDFTKTVFITRKDKEYLFTGMTVCVCHDTQ